MEIIIIAFLILLNGIFSMSEIALISARKFKLESAAKKGNQNARKALDLAGNPNTFLSTVQIGITLIGILTGIFSGEKLTDDLQQSIAALPLLAPYSETLAVLIIVIVITYFSIVFGELLPKRIGLSFPEKIATIMATPMGVISKITQPFIWLLAKTNDLFLRLLGINETNDGIVSEDEIKSIIAQSTTGGEIQQIEEDIVKRVFALGDRKANELMTHRSDIVYFDINDGLTVISEKMGLHPHAAYPVIDKSPDTFLGIVSASQILPKSLLPDIFNLKDLIKKPLFVHESMAVYKVLEQFKEHSTHIAAVVDEYGSFQGILLVNDVVDALIGDISSKLGTEPAIIQRGDDSWLVDGQYPFYEFVQYFQIPDTNPVEGFTTIGGLILHLLQRFPATGERIRWKAFEFEIVDMDGQRIDKVLVTMI